MMFRRFMAVACTAFAEAAAEPVSALLLLSAVMLVHIAPVLQYTLLSEPGRLARDGGFSALLVFGALFAVPAVLRSIGREISSGTAAAALARPVPRPMFLAGKICGALLSLLLFALGVVSAALLSEGSCIAGCAAAAARGEHGTAAVSGACFALGTLPAFAALAAAAAAHRFKSSRFAPVLFTLLALSQPAAAAYAFLSGKAPFDARVIPASIPVLAFVAVMTVSAAALACRFRPAFAGAGTAALASAAMFMQLAPPRIRSVLGFAVPDFGDFWLADALSRAGEVPWSYVLHACGAAAALSAAWFLAGCAFFASRDIS